MKRGSGWALALVMALMAPLAWAAVGPQELVQRTADQVIARIKSGGGALRADPKRLYEMVDDVVVPNFDFALMSRLVLGKFWDKASPDQQRRFQSAFQRLLVRTYSKALQDYRDQEIVYLPPGQATRSDRAVVRSEVRNPGAPPVPIEYRLYQSGSDWKIYDVVIDGVSLATNYRSSFGNELAHSGLDPLIRRLEERSR